MFTTRRITAVLLASIILLGWFAWLRPTALGGPATFVMINGDSMEPTYSHGDLVILRRSSTYQAGDVVAYPMKTYFDTGRLVIHRVVDTEGGSFVTRGDNRDSDDPWRPTAAQISGKAWLHVPRLGSAVAWLREPPHLGAFAAGTLLVGGLGSAATLRGRRHGMRRHKGAPEAPHGGGPLPPGLQSSLVVFVGVAAGAALLFALLALVAYRATPTTSRTATAPTYSETAAFGYELQMEPSTLYPDGMLRSPVADAAQSTASTGEAPRPAFSILARRARVTFDYRLEGGAAFAPGATVAADLVVRPRGGEWSRTENILPAEQFDGNAVSRTLAVDFVAVKALIARIEEETSLRGGPYEVAVVARVKGSGVYAGEPFETSFAAPFTLTLDGALIVPPLELTTRSQASTATTVEVPQSLSLVVWSPQVGFARWFSAVGLLAAVATSAGTGSYLASRLVRDDQARIRARYGSQLVDVQVGASERIQDAIAVASIRDLSRLAERFGTVILHQPLPEGHRYFVRDGEDTYEYVATARALPPSGSESSAGPSPA